jgi:hypothetical protein
MNRGLSEIDSTLADITKDDVVDVPERSAEDEQAIAEAVREVEKELGPSKSDEADYSLLVMVVVLAAVVGYYLQIKQ